MRPFLRTIRQRGRRARKGQVSAVATVLGLLLVVTFIANYLGTTLPDQATQDEFDHVIEVENQLTQLQATVLAQATHRGLNFALATPVTLGSEGVPPFSGPVVGSIQPEAWNVNQSFNWTLESVHPNTPNWGVYSSCLPAGSGTCSTNNAVDTANLSGNHSTLAVTISGSNDSLVYNINGNNDTLTITWSGSNENVVAVVMNGSYDSVVFDKSGTDTSVPSMSFEFYGIHDKYSMSMAGSHTSHGGGFAKVQFIGSLNNTCPYGNRSATDTLGALAAGGTTLNLSVTWWNAVGWVTAPNYQAYPGGTFPTEAVSFQNTSGFAACPFLKIDTAQHQTTLWGGLDVHLDNHYLPVADVGYEMGAVLVTNPDAQSQMVSPPMFWFNDTNAGTAASLILVQLRGNFTAESGVATASVLTRVTSVTTTEFGAGTNGLFVGTPYYLNFTTEFPAAWEAYFQSQGNVFPYGVSCLVHGTLPSGFTCLTPPEGTAVEISAPLYVQTIQVTIIQVEVGTT